MRNHKFSLILISLLLPTPALAFDQSGAMTTLSLLLVLGSFTLLNLMTQLAFFLSGFYRSASFGNNHVRWSVVPAVLGILLVLFTAKGVASVLMDLGLVLVALALALLPLLFIEKQVPDRPWVSVLAAVLFLALGLVITPITLFALIISHVSLPKQHQYGRYICLLNLAIGYPLLGYYLFQLVGKLG